MEKRNLKEDIIGERMKVLIKKEKWLLKIENGDIRDWERFKSKGIKEEYFWWRSGKKIEKKKKRNIVIMIEKKWRREKSLKKDWEWLGIWKGKEIGIKIMRVMWRKKDVDGEVFKGLKNGEKVLIEEKRRRKEEEGEEIEDIVIVERKMVDRKERSEVSEKIIGEENGVRRNGEGKMRGVVED